MKINYYLLCLCCAAVLTAAISCNKYTDETPDTTAQDAALVARMNNVLDNVANDGISAIEASPTLSGGRTEDWNNICDGTVAYDTAGTVKTVTVTYNGSSCPGDMTRVGVVVFTLPSQGWGAAGAVLTVNFTNFKITDVFNGYFVTMNGTKTITNIKGGLLKNIKTLDTLVNQVASNNMKMTNYYGKIINFSIDRKRVYTYDNNSIVMTVIGTHADNAGHSNIASWGTDFKGKSFYITTDKPLVFRQDCEWRVVSGVLTHSAPARVTTVTYGLDHLGNTGTCPGHGFPYYLKESWPTNTGTASTVIMAY